MACTTCQDLYPKCKQVTRRRAAVTRQAHQSNLHACQQGITKKPAVCIRKLQLGSAKPVGARWRHRGAFTVNDHVTQARARSSPWPMSSLAKESRVTEPTYLGDLRAGVLRLFTFVHAGCRASLQQHRVCPIHLDNARREQSRQLTGTHVKLERLSSFSLA